VPLVEAQAVRERGARRRFRVRRGRDGEDLLPLALVFDDPAILPGINTRVSFAVSRQGRSFRPDARGLSAWADGRRERGSSKFVSSSHSGETPRGTWEVKAVDRGRAGNARASPGGRELEVEDPKHRSNTYYNSQAAGVRRPARVTPLRQTEKSTTTIAITRSFRDCSGPGLEGPVLHTALVLPGGAPRSAVTIAPVLAERASADPRARAFPDELKSAPVIAIPSRSPREQAQLFVGSEELRPCLSSLGHGPREGPVLVFELPRRIYVLREGRYSWPSASCTTTGSRNYGRRDHRSDARGFEFCSSP